MWSVTVFQLSVSGDMNANSSFFTFEKDKRVSLIPLRGFSTL